MATRTGIHSSATDNKSNHTGVSKMKNFEAIALGEYLSEWPENMPYKDVLNHIRAGQLEEITPCEAHEDECPETLAHMINGLKNSIERLIK